MAAVQYYDFLKDLFTIDVTSKYTKETIRQFGFLVNRTCSIMYPIQAQGLNHVGINYYDAVCIWNRMLINGRGRVPGWIYTKGAGKGKKEADGLTAAEIKEYCSFHNISSRDVRDAVELLGDEAVTEIRGFLESLHANSKL